MQHHMHPVHSSWGERSTLATTTSEQVPVEVVDVSRRQLVHRKMAEMWDKVTVDD
jgi:hypothetical protein